MCIYIYTYVYKFVLFRSKKPVCIALHCAQGYRVIRLSAVSAAVTRAMANQRLNLLRLRCLGHIGGDWYQYEGYEWDFDLDQGGWCLKRRLAIRLLAIEGYLLTRSLGRNRYYCMDLEKDRPTIPFV